MLIVAAARSAVALALLVSGLAKATNRRAAVEGAAALRVPDALARLVGTLLAPAELSIAALLLVPATARIGAGLAVAMLVAFTVLLASNLARGNRPACACFGETSHKPIGPATVGRNLALLAAAVVGTFPAADATRPVVSGVVVVAAIGAFWLLQRRGRAAGASGLPIGARAPAVTLTGVDGSEWSPADGEEAVLVFTHTTCGPCRHLMPEAERWAGIGVRVGIVQNGPAKKSDEWVLPGFVRDDGRLTRAYKITATPSAVLVDGRGRIASGAHAGPLAIRSLIDATAAGRGGTAPASLQPGEAAPLLHLGRLDGGLVSLQANRGALSLVLFERAEAVGAVDGLVAHAASAAPDVALLVVTDAAPPNAEAGLASGIAVDPSGMTARAFGVTDHPAAVLVDAAGRVVDTAAGVDQVRTLIARGRTMSDFVTRGHYARRNHSS